MKPTVYIETTIPSYLVARPSAELITNADQVLTNRWWDQRRGHYEMVTSQYVLDEAAVGDQEAAAKRLNALQGIRLLEIDDKVITLAQTFVSENIIPAKASIDAGHIAVAARHHVDFLMTWNCTHIANADIQKSLGHVVRAAGYDLPLIYTPAQMLGGGNDD